MLLDQVLIASELHGSLWVGPEHSHQLRHHGEGIQELVSLQSFRLLPLKLRLVFVVLAVVTALMAARTGENGLVVATTLTRLC